MHICACQLALNSNKHKAFSPCPLAEGRPETVRTTMNKNTNTGKIGGTKMEYKLPTQQGFSSISLLFVSWELKIMA